MTATRETTAAASVAAVEIVVDEDKVHLLIELDGEQSKAVCVLSPREAHHLRSRLCKAANDAGAAQARKAR